MRSNQSRAAALGVTLLLHVLLGAWLLALRFDVAPAWVDEAKLLWVPAPVTPSHLPAAVPQLPPPRVQPTAPFSLPEPTPITPVPQVYDFSGSARDVAGAFVGGPSRRRFGEFPEAPPRRPKEEYPPSIWPKPLPRVGTTVTTADGETILWVSDYCYISLYSRSLTMQETHQGRQGVRTCVLYQFGDKKKPRDDLFDAIKQPPKPQEPGCGPDGIGLSCAR